MKLSSKIKIVIKYVLVLLGSGMVLKIEELPGAFKVQQCYLVLRWYSTVVIHCDGTVPLNGQCHEHFCFWFFS